MGSLPLADVAYLLERAFNARDDPRVGSARDNSSSTSALKVTTGTNSASISTLFVTFVPVSIYALICLLFFWIWRRKWPRVYAPRTYLSSLEPHERSEALPTGWFNWQKAFYNVPDTDVLNRSSLDGFLFLRYLKILCVICGVGCLITWPVLLPLHRYGGNGHEQLDMLTFGNVKNPKWYFVHACQAWLFFGFILYMISREAVYFVNLRQAYLLSPYYSDRLSSRTVLFTCVPYHILDERKLRKVFGESAKHIWIPRETDELDALVKDREQTANRLEKAEVTLIKMVNEAYMKALKHGHPDIATQRRSQDTMSEGKGTETWYSKEAMSDSGSMPMSPGSKSIEMDGLVSPDTPSSPREFQRQDGTPVYKTSYGYAGPPPDVNGSVAAQWISYSARPVHRPLKNYGRKVDTIKWTRTELREMAPKISKSRREYKKRRGRPIPAVFVEFDTQANAHSAYQTLAHQRANHMVPDIVGVRPEEIVWNSLRFRWWERIIRRFAVQAFIAAMVVFWSLPAAFVGLISNVKNLTGTFIFLAWINDLPSIILGLISGLLPAVALSALMALVPFLLRACARTAGVPTQAKVELFTQNAYFIFQVVQVFLITTLTSAASGTIEQILENPGLARTLLAQNLPKASNFYVSYFILQGFAMSATRMTHLGSVIRHQIMGNSGKTPRQMARRYHRLRAIHWGAVYPVFTNMGVIAISYALIAPLILGVAFIGLLIIYTTYRYNLLYIYSSNHDSRGLHYPLALTQTFTGVYFAEICLVGLFGISASFGPLVMIFALLIFTFLIHISLADALSPLVNNLPRTLMVEEELRRQGHNGLEIEEGDVLKVEEPDENPYDSDFDPGVPENGEPIHSLETTDRSLPLKNIEGKSAATKMITHGIGEYARTKFSKSPLPAMIQKIDYWTSWISPDPNIQPNFVLRWLHPEIFADYAVLRATLPPTATNIALQTGTNAPPVRIKWPEIIYDDSILKEAFCPPSVRSRAPKLWIPRDVAGVSAQEVAHTGKVIGVSDKEAVVLRNGMLNVNVERDWRDELEKVRF